MSTKTLYEVAGPAQQALVETVLAERNAQDAQWGGAEHDANHDMRDWHVYIAKQLHRAGVIADADERFGATDEQRAEYRQRLVKIAALALAAMEALDAPVGGLV